MNVCTEAILRNQQALAHTLFKKQNRRTLKQAKETYSQTFTQHCISTYWHSIIIILADSDMQSYSQVQVVFFLLRCC